MKLLLIAQRENKFKFRKINRPLSSGQGKSDDERINAKNF